MIAEQVAPATRRFKPGLTRERAKSELRLKQGIWLYFLLLLFEGALRKWVLPGLATPLLIVRDPLTLWILFGAAKLGILPTNNYYINGMTITGIVGIFTALFLGHGSLVVAIFGARILLLHFPLIFVIGKVFNQEDVKKIGKAVLWISLPMLLLIAVQFYSPQSAWVNRGVGGDVKGSGFSGALGYFRSSGTFSFTNGVTFFFSLLACFVFYFWINPAGVNRVLLIAATAALAASIPLSISRGLFFQIGVSLIFLIIAIVREPKKLGRLVLAIVGGGVLIILLTQFPFFQTATKAFLARFDSANKYEGGVKGTLGTRYLGGLLAPFISNSNLPFFGYGLGIGTNAGSALLTGKRSFLISEEEWGRLIGELGVLMGFIVIYLRVKLVIQFVSVSYKRLVSGDLLPWMLLSFAFLTVINAQWAQPTALGFSTLIAGLLVASFRVNKGSS
jgi:hypothetical protein